MRAAQRPVEPADRPDAAKRRQDANERARTVERAARALLDAGPIDARTPRGHVRVEAVEIGTTDDGLDFLDVRAAGGAETHFRIFNPPCGVRGPGGEIIDDPVGALIETLAVHGGARAAKSRRIR